MEGKHKGMLAIMLGGPPHEGGGESEPDGDEPSEGYDAAAEEMVDAIHAKDAKAFSSALHSYIKQCLADEEKGEGGGEY